MGKPSAANFAVLVDLSGTWHNERERPRNLSLLDIVGGALAKAAEEPEYCPATIRYHVIGANSLGREPVCMVTFVQSLFGKNASATTVTNRKQLQSYLTSTCPLFLNAKAEKETQIAAALATAVKSMGTRSSVRRIVILSDMREETKKAYDLTKVDLKGAEIVILYRSLPPDQEDPEQLEKRVAQWKAMLEQQGARVVDQTDAGLDAGAVTEWMVSGVPAQ